MIIKIIKPCALFKEHGKDYFDSADAAGVGLVPFISGYHHLLQLLVRYQRILCKSYIFNSDLLGGSLLQGTLRRRRFVYGVGLIVGICII